MPNDSGRQRAKRRAEQFVHRERAFRLGTLLTESSHPKTATLSQTIQQDARAGIRMLVSVDEEIAPAEAKVFLSAEYVRLVDGLTRALAGGKRVFFTGCGATGRLSILLEAAWRQFWQRLRSERPELAAKLPDLEDRVSSVMAGGDYALIKSVEGFEDFPRFGRYQLEEAGVAAGDVVVAITEGGETPFVIGTAWQGLESGAEVFFVFNNPAELLCRHVERSRQVIEEPRITKLDLTTGPMAVAGSTRMQATSAELLVVGAALETALKRILEQH
ncbi:MAG: sugar phosphate isomerase, partial [Planctomycetes bacterium]|nr:sugar phosphate isomerase [Planctomycetota bacterium]